MHSHSGPNDSDEGVGSPSKQIRRGHTNTIVPQIVLVVHQQLATAAPQPSSACANYLVTSNDGTDHSFSFAFATHCRRLRRQMMRRSSTVYRIRWTLHALLLPLFFIVSRQLQSLHLLQASEISASWTQERQFSVWHQVADVLPILHNENTDSRVTNPGHLRAKPTEKKNNLLGASETARHHHDVSDTGAQTLALLYPPGLLGGYRNQAMRFISLVTHAKKQNMTQLLLNSLLWSTQLDGVGPRAHWFPIPFQWIFDVDYWNTFAPEHLPLLVTDDQLHLGQETEGLCWTKAAEILEGYTALQQVEERRTPNDSGHAMWVHEFFAGHNATINHLQRAALLQGALTPLLHNVTVPFLTGQLTIRPHKTDFLPATADCREPHVHGGASRLWNEFLGFHQGVRTTESQHRNTSSVPFETDVWVYRALRPAPQWRTLAEQCVKQHAPNERYMALHARVELEMMGHKCGHTMEKNLTAILERVYELHENLTKGEDSTRNHRTGLLIAVSRTGMEETSLKSYERFRHFADENLRTLDIVTGRNASDVLSVKADSTSKLFQDLQQYLPVFECGERFVENYYATHPDTPIHGSLLNSVLNFHVAVNADIFVGVKDSSYSTDVLTTRFWLGKGDANYRYTQNSIERIEGLPEPHSNCKK